MQAIELFAGAGGLGLGVSRAGFKPKLVVEWDKHCEATLNANRERGVGALKKWPEVRALDVRDIDYSAWADKIDFVTGGPPCQPFSLGGKHKAHADARDMFPEAVRAVRETRPKAFLFENVKGLTRATFRSYFEYISLQMRHPYLTARDGEDWSDHLTRLEKHHTSGRQRDLEYRVVSQVLNAADYGVPQRRERVFFVGFRADLGIEWSFPKPTHSQATLLWEQRDNGEYWERNRVSRRARARSLRFDSGAEKLAAEPGTAAWVTTREAIADLPDPEKRSSLNGWLNHTFQPGARTYPGHTGSPLDEPAKTLKAGVHGVPGGENMMLRPDGSVRYFTVRESARLQTFPDDFEFRGSWSEVMRQLGNAVPVKLAETIALDIKAKLNDQRRG